MSGLPGTMRTSQYLVKENEIRTIFEKLQNIRLLFYCQPYFANKVRCQGVIDFRARSRYLKRGKNVAGTQPIGLAVLVTHSFLFINKENHTGQIFLLCSLYDCRYAQ